MNKKNKESGKNKFCAWIYDETSDHYDTSCGEAYCTIEGTLKENNLNYCPFCGLKIDVA